MRESSMDRIRLLPLPLAAALLLALTACDPQRISELQAGVSGVHATGRQDRVFGSVLGNWRNNRRIWRNASAESC